MFKKYRKYADRASMSFSLIAIVTLSGCSVEREVTDFEMICNYFGELKVALSSKEMNDEQRNDFIMERIRTDLSESSSARAAWEAISAADPVERYELFMYAAESSQEADWECEPMKELAAFTGVFE